MVRKAPPAERDAHNRLTAAAPSLLSALEGMLAYFEANGFGDFETHAERAVVDAARAAIEATQ